MGSASAVGPSAGPRAPAHSGGLPPDDPLRLFDGRGTEKRIGFQGDSLEEVLEEIIESWPAHGISDHLAREVAAVHKGAPPLKAGARVPACVCPDCTGIPDEAPAWTLRTPAHARKMESRVSWEGLVGQARGVPLLEVVQRLGLGTPQKQGKELAVRCPFHEDRDPSLQLNAVKQLWYCHPCGEGGDGLRLFMRTRRIGFAEAVKALAA